MYPYILKQEAWVELIDVATAYIKLNPSGECLPSDSRTYFKENGFRYTDYNGPLVKTAPEEIIVNTF